MIIDANMYWIPESLFTDSDLREKFLGAIPKQYGVHAYSATIPESGKCQIVIEKPRGYQNFNYVEGQYEIGNQIRDMDEAGITKAILKIPGCQEWLSLELCRIFNDGMAAHVRDGKGRFSALAVVPPFGTKENIRELERCVKDLGMTGVQLSAHYGELYLDDEAFRPFFSKVNELRLPVYVHHTSMPIGCPSIIDYNNLRRSYGRCVDQTIAVGREIFSDFFQDFPDIKIVHSMLGGAFFSYMSLMFPPKNGGKEAVARFNVDVEKARNYLNENVFFEMSHASPWGKKQLECAIDIFGADHVIFGTSYPVKKEWMASGPSFVGALDIGDAEKDQILSGNAKKIYGV